MERKCGESAAFLAGQGDKGVVTFSIPAFCISSRELFCGAYLSIMFHQLD
jgi:hypothetical protein